MPALLLFFALIRPAEAAAPRIDPRIFAGKAPGERATVLVVLREQPDLSGAASIRDRAERRRFVYEALRAHAAATQGPLLERLRASGAEFRSHFLFNMVEVEADASLAQALAVRADVSGVEANLGSELPRPKPGPGSPLAPRAAAVIEPNLEQVRAPELWARGATGQGIVVGSADTGFEWEPAALRAHYRGWDGTSASHDYNWHDAIHDAVPDNVCGSDAAAPCDDDGHGTATSGLMVGDDGGGNRIGVAPGARLIGCRNMDKGNGTPARYTECFEWFLAPTDAAGQNPRPDLGADVINNSWGCPASEGCTSPDILQGVIENVRAAGIAVVVAAGNSGGGSGSVLPTCSTISDVPAFYDAGRGRCDRRHRVVLEHRPGARRRLEPVEARSRGARRLRALVRARRRLLRRFLRDLGGGAARRGRGGPAVVGVAGARRRRGSHRGGARARRGRADRGSDLRRVPGDRRPECRLRLGPPRRSGRLRMAAAAARRARPARISAPAPSRSRAALRPAGSE